MCRALTVAGLILATVISSGCATRLDYRRELGLMRAELIDLEDRYYELHDRHQAAMLQLRRARDDKSGTAVGAAGSWEWCDDWSQGSPSDVQRDLFTPPGRSFESLPAPQPNLRRPQQSPRPSRDGPAVPDLRIEFDDAEPLDFDISPMAWWSEDDPDIGDVSAVVDATNRDYEIRFSGQTRVETESETGGAELFLDLEVRLRDSGMDLPTRVAISVIDPEAEGQRQRCGLWRLEHGPTEPLFALVQGAEHPSGRLQLSLPLERSDFAASRLRVFVRLEPDDREPLVAMRDVPILGAPIVGATIVGGSSGAVHAQEIVDEQLPDWNPNRSRLAR